MFTRFLPCLLLICAVSPSLAQSNDDFASRLPLSGAGVTAVSNNLRATREAGEPDHAGASVGRSLWWTWTAPSTGTVVFSTYDGSSGTHPPRAIGVYTGGSLTALTEVASSNDDAQSAYLAGTDPTGFGGGSTVSVQVQAGQAYQIAVDALAGSAATGPDDGTVAFSINAPLTILSAANAVATVGTAFSYAVRASGNPSAYAVTGLPGGLSYNAASGIVSGTPTTAGNYPVGLSATGPGGTGTATLTLRVDAAVPDSSVVPVIYSAASARGYLNAYFSYNLQATGNPTAFSAANLPPGLGLDAQSGAILGLPTSVGEYGVTVTATGPGGTGTASLMMVIRDAAPIIYITAPLAVAASLNASFSYTLPVTINNPADQGYSLSFSATNLPPGLSMDLDGPGTIQGTPTQAGVFSVPVTLSSGGVSRQTTLTITVADPAAASSARPVLTSAAAAVATVGMDFSYRLTATNSPTGFTTAALPPGLTCDQETGLITGNPTTAGTYAIGVSATNGSGTSEGTLTITISPLGDNGYALPIIGSPAMAVVYTGQPCNYVATISYQGVAAQPPGRAWTISASGLPPGLSLSSLSNFGTARVSGTPTTPGTYPVTLTTVYPASVYNYNSATIRPDATTTAVVTFLVKAGPAPALPVIGSPAAASFTRGTQGSYQTSSTGGATSYGATGLPPGMSIAASTGLVSGTPTTAGTYPAKISATNSVGTITVTVTFIVAPTALPFINSASTASGTVGAFSGYTITTYNGATSYGASNLPSGMSFNATTGVISGTPSTAGVYTVPISATDSGGTTTATLTYTIRPPTAFPPYVNGNPLSIATINQTFGVYLSNGVSATYSASNLPPGLSLNSANGLISGTPTTLGRYTVPVSQTNSLGTCTATLTIVVANPALPVLTTLAASAATSGQNYTYNLGTSNGVAATFAVTGLPAGLSYNANSKSIVGKPTTTGVYLVTINASNAAGTTTQTLTLTVNPVAGVPVFLYGPPLDQTTAVGSGYSLSVATTPAATSYAATNLPPGLSLNAATGAISGTATTTGLYPATFTATNSAGSASVRTVYTVSPAVNAAPNFILLPATVIGYAGTVFPNIRLSAYSIEGAPASTYAATGLPDGLTLDPATGTIAGTPTTQGQTSVAISIGNSAGTNTAVLTIVIRDPMRLAPVFDAVSAELGVQIGLNPVGFKLAASIRDDGDHIITTPLNFSVTGLPPGLTPSASANSVSLQGAPTAAGSWTATFTATLPGGGSTRAAILFWVPPLAKPLVSSSAEMAGSVAVEFYGQIYSNQSSQTTVSYSAGPLPPGLRLNTVTGQITGTPTAAGTYPVDVTVTSPNGTSAAVITIRIEQPLYDGLPVITSAASVGSQEFPPDSSNGTYRTTDQPTTDIHYELTAINHPTAFSMGELPAGLSFNPSTGILSGVPAALGVFRVPISASNAVGTASSTLTIISTSPLPLSQASLTYETYVGGACHLATGTAFPAIAFPFYYQTPLDFLPYTPPTVIHQASGLPPGLSLNTTTGVISGVPTRAGSYPVTLSTTDRAGTTSAVVTISVASSKPADTLPVFGSDGTSIGYVSVPLVYRLSAPGATQYSAATLPGGLALDPAAGVISGTPTSPGTFAVPVTASNSAGTTSATLTFQVENVVLPPTVTSPAAYAATVGQPFVGRIVTTNLSPMPAVTGYSASLPEGLQLNPATGELSGTPTGSAGTYKVFVQLYSAARLLTTFAQTFTILPAPATSPLPVLGTPAGSLAFVSNPYLYTIRSSAFVPTGSLPAGLIYDALAGTIKGDPTTAGTYFIPLAASPGNRGLPRSGRQTGAAPNGNGAADALLTLRVTIPALSPPRFTVPPANVVATRGQTATLTAAAVGSPEPSYQWSRHGVPVAGATGASLSFPGVTPADAGEYTVTATNVAGTLVSSPVTLVVLTTFDQWQGDYFSPAEIAAGLAAGDQDASGDGVVNLLEYALGLDPRANNSGALPVVIRTGAAGALQITFERDGAKSDLNYLVESSPDLRLWTSVAQSVGGSTTVAAGGAGSVVETGVTGTSRSRVTVSANPPTTAGRQFLRLRVARP